jgi:hypothetical protein
MGLAIVKKYLDSINGEIALNINDHGGSSIYVKIPCPKRHEYINLPADAFNETHKKSSVCLHNLLFQTLILYL